MCPAFGITATADLLPPVMVCIGVPHCAPASVLRKLRRLHGETGRHVHPDVPCIDQPGTPPSIRDLVDSLAQCAAAALEGAQPDAGLVDGFD